MKSPYDTISAHGESSEHRRPSRVPTSISKLVADQDALTWRKATDYGNACFSK
jgi:hypothetical protein